MAYERLDVTNLIARFDATCRVYVVCLARDLRAASTLFLSYQTTAGYPDWGDGTWAKATKKECGAGRCSKVTGINTTCG